MVKLVDDHVVEGGRVELGQHAGEPRDRGKHDVAAEVPFAVDPQRGSFVGQHLGEDVAGLGEDLLAMGDEQGSRRVDLCDVEGRQPRLAEPRGHDDEAGLVAVEAGGAECGEHVGLHTPGRGDVLEGFVLDDVDIQGRSSGTGTRSGGGESGALSLERLVADKPFVGEHHRTAIRPQAFEFRREHRGVAGAEVPFDAAGERGVAEVAAADEADADRSLVGGEQVRLGVKARRGIVEDADLERTPSGLRRCCHAFAGL